MSRPRNQGGVRTVRARLRHALDFRARLVEKFGYRNRILASVCGVRKNSTFGLNGLDRQLIAHMPSTRGYYIELGANDGVSQSNTLVLEIAYGWSGCLIEPVSSSFKRLEHNRSSERNHLVNAACVSFGYQGDTVSIALSNLMSTPMVASSDIPDVRAHVLGSSPDSSAQITFEEVRARTLTSVLAEANAPAEIQLLSLDVEGGELEVLKGIDFSKFKISWMLIESRSPHEISEFLARFGYFLQKKLSHHDFLFRLM